MTLLEVGHILALQAIGVYWDSFGISGIGAGIQRASVHHTCTGLDVIVAAMSSLGFREGFAVVAFFQVEVIVLCSDVNLQRWKFRCFRFLFL